MSEVTRSLSAEPEEQSPPSNPRATRFGRYELLFELARGGMGAVFVARLTGAYGFDRLLAVKVLSSSEIGDTERRSLLAEARLTARIHHPNVVETFELGEHEGIPFIAMQLLPGASLARVQQRARATGLRLPVDVVAWIAREAAAGLHAAHELAEKGRSLGVVHRDVSPQNILLSFDGRVAVADFGIAKLGGEEYATSRGVVKGKFAYMSPEQSQALSVDRRTDVFALGVVIWESLTSRRLFAGKGPADTLVNVLSKPIVAPSTIEDAVPPELDALVLACLERDPERRLPSAGALSDRLRDFLRTRGAVDGRDVASLLERLYPGERERFEARVSAARPSADRDPEPARAPAANAELGTFEAATVTEAGSARRRRWAVPVLGLVVLALVASAGLLWLQRGRDATLADAHAGATPSAGPGPSAASVAATALAREPEPPASAPHPVPAPVSAGPPPVRAPATARRAPAEPPAPPARSAKPPELLTGPL